MTNDERVALYVRDLLHKYADGYARLTPAQRRRVRKHDRRMMGFAETLDIQGIER